MQALHIIYLKISYMERYIGRYMECYMGRYVGHKYQVLVLNTNICITHIYI